MPRVPNPNGRPKGVPNKATTQAREAIAAFVGDNAERLNTWLDAIAKGIPHPSDEGKFLVYPDPDAAFKAYMSVVEYHIPKLARTEQQFLDKDGEPTEPVLRVQFVE